MKDIIKEVIREELLKTQQKTYCFMAGLPRSGSTLLSAILNQNPRIHSGPSSPVTSIMLTLENVIASDELFRAYPKPAQAGEIIANVIKHYYSDVDKPVIIDKNRSWVNRMHYIPGYFGVEPKIICPVRNIDEILASFITMHKRNPFDANGRINFIDEMLIKTNTPLTDDNRCEFLASSNGILGQSVAGIRQALMEGRQRQIHFVEYDELISSPRETMKKLYDFLGEEYFEHDFANIINQHKEDDASVYGFTDMHDVRSTLEKKSIDPKDILSPAILERCAGSEFWRNLEEYVPPDTSVQAYDATQQTPSSPEEDTNPTNIIGA
jgi:sulfotransferase